MADKNGRFLMCDSALTSFKLFLIVLLFFIVANEKKSSPVSPEKVEGNKGRGVVDIFIEHLN
jgi:hypothetical protein